MRWIKTILHEVFGLFVDDGSFALAIVVWLLAVKLLVTHFLLTARWTGLLLFGGLAVILAESALRASRGPAR